MAYVAQYDGDVRITGGLYGLTVLRIPAGTVNNEAVATDAAIAASKLQKSLRARVTQVGTAATETHTLFFVLGSTLTFKHVRATNITPCAGSSTVTIDIEKNGTTILSSVITLDSTTGAYSEQSGTLSVTSAVDGDYIEAIITATQSGTDALATGVMVQLDYNEDYLA